MNKKIARQLGAGRRKILALCLAGVGIGSSVMADGSAPIDFSVVGTQVSGWAEGAATAGVVILTLIIGIQVMKRVFKTTAS